jgi:REP element-mobilizing transposase RayT
MAIGFLLSFGTYGTHLHGDDRGSHRFGGAFVPPNRELREATFERLKETPFTLTEGARDVVLKAIIGVASYRHWELRAAHVRTEHVHVVVCLPQLVKPAKAMVDFKAYSTRALRENGILRRKYWAERGHCLYLRDEDALNAACAYVYDKQGEPMARYAGHDDRSLTRPAND